MAMLISKFHRLIQNKITWWTILGIIVLTFVVWGTAMPGQRKQQNANSPGSLEGKPVSAQEFQSAKFNSYLSVILAMGRDFNITREIDAQLREAAWQRLAALREAERLGMTASRDEVANTILQNPVFQSKDGQFQKAAYKAFVTQFLAQKGFTEKQFEEHVRQEILLQKVKLILNRATLVPPYEVKRTFNSISDRFKIEYAAIGPELVTNSVHVSEADAKTFYDRDPSMFKTPEKMVVRYVRFAVAPFIPKAHVQPEDVEAYYNEHMDDYLADTNSAAAASDSTNLIVTSKYKPFADVKQDISNQMIHDQALELASERAMEFVMDVTPDRDGKALSFEDAAKKYETIVQVTEPFSARDDVEGTDAGVDFVKAAFSLGEDVSMGISEPVRGKESVYVLGFKERIPARVPAFEEVKKEVMPFAEAQAISDALSGKSKELRDAATKAVQAGQPFASAFAGTGVHVETSLPFTANTGPTTNEYSDLLMRGIMTLNQGEVSELLPAKDAVLVAHVIERVPGDPTTFDSLKQQIENTIRRQNGRWVYESFQEYLLQKDHLERHDIVPDTADEEPEPEADTNQEANS